MDLSNKVMVFNRAAGEVFYSLADLRVRREWVNLGDRQLVSIEELQALKFAPGGAKLLERYLLIKDQEVCEFLEIPCEPEYFYDENSIRVLLKEGSMDQLLDCLEFAPNGVLDIIKKVAVETKLDSAEKRHAISEHLKINIDAMIKNNEASKGEDSTTEAAPTRQRRSAPVATTTEAPSKYNVVSRSK